MQDEEEQQLVERRRRVVIPTALRKAVTDGMLTKEIVDKFSVTDRYRMGIFPKALEFTMKEYGHRGLPLIEDFELYSHQIRTIEFMKQCEIERPLFGITGGFILLMMGLGKSLTSVSHSLLRPKGEYPTLIVCPKTLMREWKYECFEQFFNTDGVFGVKVLYFHNDFMPTRDILSTTRDTFREYDFVVTTYDTLISAYSKDSTIEAEIHNVIGKSRFLKRRESHHTLRSNPRGITSLFYTPWERMICDESHKFANSETQRHKAIMGVCSKFTWCLSGTWIRNRTTDIFSQLKVCGYNGVKTLAEWKKNGKSMFHADRLYNRILEMDYKQAGVHIPEHTSELVKCEITGEHRKLYDQLNDDLIKSIGLFDDGVEKWVSVFEKFTRLRQISIAPYIMYASSPDRKSSKQLKWAEDIHGPGGTQSPKIQKLIDIVSKIPRGEKFVVFSFYKTALNVVNAAIESSTRLNVHLLTGELSGSERNAIIASFKDDDSINGMLMTYGVGSEGINFTCANHVILLEPWWSNAVHFQAYSRCVRMGQRKNVNVYYLITDNTIEENVLNICNEKLEEAAEFLLDEKSKDVARNLGREMLGRIVNYKK
jgi:SNF2 family DNA or RNA helicase